MKTQEQASPEVQAAAIADEFKTWLKEHPRSTRRERAIRFDEISDTVCGETIFESCCYLNYDDEEDGA